jgi:lipopolysaccharide transport system ATP-binding protein
MTNNNTVIKLQGVSKKYKLFNSKTARMKEALHPLKKKYHREFYALNNINLEVAKGEILGIVGVNGSGKSTLLKIISGIIPPSGGTCSVKGRVIPLLELGSGFNPEFTGLENIYFYNRLNGYTRKQTDAVLDDILDFAEIGDFIHQPLKTYSSGMKARLGFAVSVNIDPDILILDEVLSVGDELFRRKCYARMEQFFEGGKTILFVSHSVPAINQICTRSVLLSNGELILEGPTKLVTAQYERYLYAKKEMMPNVREEIVAMNKNEALKAATYAELAATKEAPAKPQHPADEPVVTPTTHETAQQAAKELLKPKGYYHPNLKPVSTTITRNTDVDITDIKILDLQGNNLNVLCQGEFYIFSFTIKPHVNLENIRIGISFSTKESLIVVGYTIPSQNSSIEKMLAHQNYYIEINFECLLSAGTYYTMVGLTTDDKSGKYYHNIIKDASLFKVQPNKEKNNWGLVSLKQKYKIIKNEKQDKQH